MSAEYFDFGPFRLFAKERRLVRDEQAVPLGSRALDILNVLVENAGEVVTKQDLLARVWPNIAVEESSLRVHIAGLRKALGDGQDGARYISNIAGRGYSFVAKVARKAAEQAAPLPEIPMRNGLPNRSTRTVGREGDIAAIAGLLVEHRFITIVGPGGIGKTTVATAIGHLEAGRFGGQVCYFDIGPLPPEPSIVPGMLAMTLGLVIQEGDTTEHVIRHLRGQRMLIIFDCCDHVVHAAAELAERIFREAPGITILATSREALRVEGEQLYPLAPLDCPPVRESMTAAEILAFPAVQLFVDRAKAAIPAFELRDSDAARVAALCRQLDGLALAIELAAGRISMHGLAVLSDRLDERLKLSWQGKRTAIPRHQTLRATLDWSYDLLTETERAVLQRLSLFVGCFTLEAVEKIAADDAIDGHTAISAFDTLLTKSLVFLSDRTRSRYRMLDTTRAYAAEKLRSSGDAAATAERHARFFLDFLKRSEAHSIASIWEDRGNVITALEWAFQKGDAELAPNLAAAASHYFWELSLLNECYSYSERAISLLDEDMRGSPCEMTLEAALGLSLMFMRGQADRVRSAYGKSLAIAEELHDPLHQLRVLGRLHMFHERSGEFQSALAAAQRCSELAKEIGDPGGIAAAHSMLGISHHLMGDQATARTFLEMALAQPASSRQVSGMYFGFDYQNRARITFARALWLAGWPEKAVRIAEESIEEAARLAHPVPLCIALLSATSVFNWVGDFDRAEECIDRFAAHAEKHSLTPYHSVGLGLRGELAIKRGDIENGIAVLRQVLEVLHADRYAMLATSFNSALAEGLAKSGRPQQGLQVIQQTIATAERNGDLICLPELLRIKGELLHALDAPGATEALFSARDLARQQSARSWALRSTISLSKIDTGAGRADLDEVFSGFTEGFDTLDLRAAKQLLEAGARPS